MKKLSILNIIFFLAIIAGDVVYMLTNTLLSKSITSILFVVLGVINFVFALKNKTTYKNFVMFMLIGLCFACLGDILLEIEFIVGAILFAVGHIFYFVAYCNLQKFNPKDLIYGACIFVPATLIICLVPIFDFGGILMQIVCIAYALIISLMVGKAIANFINNKSVLNIIILIGGCLFFFSDFTLLFNVFADVNVVFGVLCLATYYPAEVLLAYSILNSSK